MLLGALLLEHLAKAAESVASGLANDNLGVVETSLNEGPQAVEVGLDEERAALDDDSECGDGGLAHARVGGASEGTNLLEEGREDLGGRKGGGEGVDHAEGSAGGNVVVGIGRLGLGTDGEEGGDDGASKAEGLDLALLAVNQRTSGQRFCS